MKLLRAMPLPPSPPVAQEVQREVLNQQAKAKGVYCCPGCDDAMGVKPFHETPYAAGRFRGQDAPNGDPGAEFNGVLGLTALCEDCWAGMTPEERVPYYRARLEARRKGIPSVLQRVVDGVLADDPADAARRAVEMAALDAEIEQVLAAVMEGR